MAPVGWLGCGDFSSHVLSVYLVALPNRAFSAMSAYADRLHSLTSARSASPFSLNMFKAALPSSSLLTASMFPHVSSTPSSANAGQSRSLHLVTFSPIFLARQEAKVKRVELERIEDEEAARVGRVAGAIGTVEEASRRSDKGAWVEISNLALTLNKDLGAPSKSGSLDGAALAMSLRSLLSSTLHHHTLSVTHQVHQSARPPWITRNWPRLVFYPFALLTVSRVVYNSRDTLYRWIRDGRETAKGFLIGWLVKPIEGILDTMRGGTEEGVALMGKESLRSDLEVSTSFFWPSSYADG